MKEASEWIAGPPADVRGRILEPYTPNKYGLIAKVQMKAEQGRGQGLRLAESDEERGEDDATEMGGGGGSAGGWTSTSTARRMCDRLRIAFPKLDTDGNATV